MSNPLAVVRALLAHDSNGAASLVRVAALNFMRKEVEIVNKLGLHARPASEFVRCVIRFKSKITICKGEENFSADSILEVLSADLDCGARVVLEAIEPDEQEALNQLEGCCCVFAMKKVGLRETEARPGRPCWHWICGLEKPTLKRWQPKYAVKSVAQMPKASPRNSAR